MNSFTKSLPSPRRAANKAAALMCGIAMAALLVPEAYAQNAASPPATTASNADQSVSNADNSVVADIIVTAQKRSESAQKTPLAITAIGGAALRTSGVASVDALIPSVPSLQLGKFYGVANVTLRGVALSALNAGVESPVAFHVDGIYYGRPAAVLSSFFDVERVEVLRGAQGTLYGRNATGGSINIITADPTATLSGFAQATYGNYDHADIEAAVGGPLSDKVQFRIAGRWDSHDGYGLNEATGRPIDDNHEHAIRGKLKFLPTDNLTILVEGDYSQAHSNGAIHLQGTVAGGPLFGTLSNIGGTPFPSPGLAPTNIRDVSQETDPQMSSKFWGLGSTINLDLGPVTLRSITGYRHSQSKAIGDIDETSAPLISPFGLSDDANQVSQELQAVGKTDRSNWIVGGYFYHEKDNGREVSAFSNVFLPLFGAPLPPAGVYLAQGLYTGSWIKTTAYAIFGQYTRRFSRNLSVTLGGRYSIETKEELNQNVVNLGKPFVFSQFFVTPAVLSIQCGKGVPTIGYGSTVCSPSTTYKAFTPKAGIDYQIGRQALVYASYSKGFKSGTYNLGVAQDPVKPEKLDDFELGFKSTLLGGQLRANLAGFYYNYKDVQVFNGLPTQTYLQNAATAKIYGLEAEIVAKLVRSLQLDMSGSWLHATYSNYQAYDQLRPAGDGHTLVPNFAVPGTFLTGFNLDGNHLPQAPELSGRVGAAYTFASAIGDFTLRGETVYTGKLYITQFNTCPVGCVAAHTRFNASLNYTNKDGHFYANLNIKNITDKVLLTSGFAGTPLAGGVISGYLEPPRTVDFTVGYKF